MDWTQFTLKIRINADIDKVYQAWADRDKITTWFLATCKQIQPKDSRVLMQKGDLVEWSWHNYPNESKIEIKAANGKDHMIFTFGEGMEVEIKISKEEDLSVLSLRQYNIPIDDTSKYNFYLGCSRAWATWIMNLKSWLEHEILLHDTNLGKREDLFNFVNT